MGSHCSTTEEEVTKMTLTRDELATLLIFQRITDSWVREVHRFESMRKRRKHFVIFRDANNRKLTSLAELKAEGVEVDESSFQTADCDEIVSNKVGANKKARRAVRAWTNELMGGEKPAVVKEVSESGVSAAEAAAAEKAAAEKAAAEAAAAEKAAAEKAAAEKLAAEAAAAEAAAAAEKAAAEKLAAEVAAAELAAAEAAAAEAAAVEAAAAEAAAAAEVEAAEIEEVAVSEDIAP